MKYYFIALLITLIILSVAMNDNNFSETYENDPKHIEFYVISMKKENRLINIQTQLDKINTGRSDDTKLIINVVDAVIGADLNQHELIDKKILSAEYNGNGEFESKQRKSEIGCYMSHVKIYNLIKERNLPGYSVYFEDDFNIVTDEFLAKVRRALEIMKDKDFDLMYLGTNYGNHGDHIKEDLYHIDKGNTLYGAHAILINNKNIDKIIEQTKYIEVPVDVRLEQLCHGNELVGVVIYPHLVLQQFDTLDSTITVAGFSLLNNNLTFSPVAK
jgi:GR25 family glycosyltransferase involved in LPS biosynthesis